MKSQSELVEKAAFVLPERARTQRGIEFFPREDVWAFRDALNVIRLDFSLLKATPEFVHYAKYVLCWYLENRASSSAKALYYTLKRFIEFVASTNKCDVHSVESSDILNFSAFVSGGSTGYLDRLVTLLKKWADLEAPGLSDDTIRLLKNLKRRPRSVGSAVLTMDPIDGPFSDIEFEAIRAKSNIAYEDGDLSLSDYVLVLLAKAFGQRPVQYASLKICDFDRVDHADGSTTYSLKIPRAKQRNTLIRERFKDRLLVATIGELVDMYCQEVKAEFVGKLVDPMQAPLFPRKKSKGDEPRGFEYHQTSDQITRKLSEIIESLEIVSERTGEPLHVTTYRFRHTTGTRAAVEGHGELVIAELLDHSDTQCVGIYVQSVPKIVERIDRAMALHLAPLAQAFEGVIITNEAEAICSDDAVPGRICDPRFDPTMKPMGNCGKHGFCGSMAPISCYTCRSFQPWLDGPHEAVLDYLITERERQLDKNDSRIARINDRTILAVAEVVRQCAEIKANGFK